MPDWTLERMNVHLGLIARSVQVLENTISNMTFSSESMINIQSRVVIINTVNVRFVMVPLVKVKKHLLCVGRLLRFRRPENKVY